MIPKKTLLPKIKQKITQLLRWWEKIMKRIIWIQTNNRFSDFGDDDLSGFEYFMSTDLENTLITSFIL